MALPLDTTTDAYAHALQASTLPDTCTEWMDERWDFPPIDESQRAQYQDWLSSSGFPAASDPQMWNQIQANWVSFLSATSAIPQAELAPRRKVATFGPRAFEPKSEQDKRFKVDRVERRTVERCLWEVFDSLEGLTERWPIKARILLNEPFDGGENKPLETLAAKVNLRRRRRFNCVWNGLICFLVYSWSEGTLENMGLHLTQDMDDNISDINMGFSFGNDKSQIRHAIEVLCKETIMDPAATFESNPLLWWVGVLVQSALWQGPPDSISRGRFNMNLLCMDLSIQDRLEGLRLYSKVMVLDAAFNSWNASSDFIIQIQDDLNQPNQAWINADDDQRPSADLDQRSCTSTAWKDLLKRLRQYRKQYLGEQKGTVMRQIWSLLQDK